MKEDTNTTLVGTVIFIEKNIGSKSEGVFPFLYLNKDNRVPIMLRNDNPFENRGLLPFDGKTVEVTGTTGRGGVFLISVIRPTTAEMTIPEPDAESQGGESQK